MKSSILIVLLFLGSTIYSFACYNLYSIDARGEVKETLRGIPTIEHSFKLEFAEEFVNYFDFNDLEDYSFEDLSDATVYLSQLGRVDEALELLQWLHQKHPNEYNITANLGATFELAGNIDSAEFYLTKAVELNTSSESNNEWIHLKILEAKRQMAKDPNWILQHNVLGLKLDTSFYAAYSDSIFTDRKRDSIRQVRYEIYEQQFDTLWYIGLQMRTHIPFSPVPNLIIANIMKELGDYLAINLSTKDAFVSYKIALFYDPGNQLKIKQELNKLMPHFRKYEFDEAIFENRFHAAKPFSESDLKYLPQYRNGKIETANNVSSALFWQAGLAILLLFGIFIRIAMTGKQK
jgi:tetratricopeptide (TPR) repeat protein